MFVEMSPNSPLDYSTEDDVHTNQTPTTTAATRMTRRRILTAGIGVLSSAGLAACGGEDRRIVVTPERDGPAPVVIPTFVELANSNTMADAPLFVALERSSFSAETLEPRIQLRADETELIDLLTGGGTELTLTALGPAFFNALHAGHDLKIAGPITTDIPPLSIPLMVSRGRFDAGDITTISDLRGGTIGLARPGFSEYLLGKALETGGLDLADVSIEVSADRRLRTRLERGLVDAAMIGEPEATEAMLDLQAHPLADAYLPAFTASFAVTTSDFLAENLETVSGFFRSMYSACAEMLEGGFNSPRNQTIFQLYHGSATEVLAQMNPYSCTMDGAVNIEEVQSFQQFYLDNRMLNFTTEIDISTIVDDRLAREAAAATFSR